MSTTTPLAPTAQGDAAERFGPLAERLAGADRILQKERGGARMLQAWPWAPGLVLGCFATDVVLHLAGGVRAGLSVAGAGLALGFAGW